MRRPRRLVAVLDYNKCHPEKCDKGICAAVEVCPVKVIKQEPPYEPPEIVQHMCVGYEYWASFHPRETQLHNLLLPDDSPAASKTFRGAGLSSSASKSVKRSGCALKRYRILR
jgi:hypothetical protein